MTATTTWQYHKGTTITIYIRTTHPICFFYVSFSLSSDHSLFLRSLICYLRFACSGGGGGVGGQLVQLQEQLHSEDAGPSLDIVRAIQQISRDMHMITFYLRPMKVVATQLITVRFCYEAVHVGWVHFVLHSNNTGFVFRGVWLNSCFAFEVRWYMRIPRLTLLISCLDCLSPFSLNFAHTIPYFRDVVQPFRCNRPCPP